MSFLYPSFLWALTAMAVPVIIHLFSFRRHKTVYFSQTRFLESVRKDTRSRTNLKHLLILLSRMLLIAALVMAFAQPVILPEDAEADEKVSRVMVYVDNSYSMQNEGEKGSLIDMAAQKAVEIAEAWGESVQYQLITNDMPPRFYRPMGYETFLQEVGQLDVSPVSLELKSLVTRMKSAIANENISGRIPVYLISDFQKSTMAFDGFDVPDKFDVSAVLTSGAARENLSIDSVWFDSPFRQAGGIEHLTVLVKNHGNEDYSEIPLELYLNDSLRAVSSVNVDAGHSATAQLTYTNPNGGFQRGVVSLDDYPVSFDNRFYFTYPLKSKRSVLLVNGSQADDFPLAVFDDPDRIELKQVEADVLDFSLLDQYDVIILNGPERISAGLATRLQSVLESAKVLILLPGKAMHTESWNRFAAVVTGPRYSPMDTGSVKLSGIAWEHPFFEDVFNGRQENVDLPLVNVHYPMRETVEAQSESLLSLKNGTSFLSLVPFDNSLVYFFSAPVGRTFADEFIRHPLFIPVAYNMILNTPLDQPLYYISGRRGSLKADDVPESEGGVEILMQDDNAIVPAFRETREGLQVFIPEDLKHARHYSVFVDDEYLRSFALNTDAAESVMAFYNEDELRADAVSHGMEMRAVFTGDSLSIQSGINESQQGKALWFYFLLAALFFVLVEIMLIKLM
ncbi:MAG TPA: BatA domain-containing protein [Bacteroidales bacterium]|nr:BatA domain-containing protein [Bacteroidales bacterium]